MPNKAIFLDRDDTLIDDPGYISDPNQVQLLDGVPGALNSFRKMDYELVVVTNQSGIARGIFTEDTLKSIHARFEELLAEKHAYVDRIYYCPYHVDGVVEEYKKASDLRKPSPGMLLQAAKDMDIDLDKSWCIGNSLSDVEAGQRAGCVTILIDKMSPTGRAKPGQIRPDYIAVNLREAVNIVKQYQAAERHQTPDPAEEEAVATRTPEPVTEPRDEVSPEPIESAPESTVASPAPVVDDVSPALPAEVPPKRKKKKKKNRPIRTRVMQPQESPDPDHPKDPTDQQLLQGILDQLKSMQRDELFDEFSLLRFVAGVAQIGVFVCLVIAVWFLLSPERPFDSIFTTLGFALVLQTMCLTLTIQSRR